jgi:hypothetical protein
LAAGPKTYSYFLDPAVITGTRTLRVAVFVNVEFTLYAFMLALTLFVSHASAFSPLLSGG